VAFVPAAGWNQVRSARVGLVPEDNAAAEDAEDVLIAEIAVASGNLRTVYEAFVTAAPF
jgi:hypothetical protein